ncbi:MAG: M28 family peptidase [Nitrospira sp.]
MTLRLLTHLQALVGERHPLTTPDHLVAVEMYMADRFEAMGCRVTHHCFVALDGTYRNVIATLDSASNSSCLPPLLIGAHYDTVPGSPGADDNASALAVLLETAQSLSGVSLVRPIRFVAFCLEEDGLLGSSAYTAMLRQQKETLAGAIILECVGYARSEEGTQQAPPRVPVAVPTVGNFLAVIGNDASEALTSTVARAMKTHVPVVPLVVPGNGALLPDTRRSDHATFWDQGFPAVMVTDTANFRNHYHQPGDTLDTLNLDFMSQVAHGLVASAKQLAGMNDYAT